MVRLIKRYGNRKLYDTHASAYITLDAIAALVRGGQDVRVIDNDSGSDLTALIFAQIIVEEQKKKSGSGLLSMPVLRWIIQEGESRIQEFLSRVDKSREAIDNVRDMAEKGVERLVKKSGELLESPQRGLDALQRQIDTQVRRSVEAIAGHPAVQSELTRIQTSLHRLEEQIRRLRVRSEKPKAARSIKGRKRAHAAKERRDA
jgi:polyhydroxyalkanoate synthesis repressor PhaR